MRGNRKKDAKNFFEKGKVKKQKKMREERKIEKVSRLVIGNIVRHKCIIFIKSVLNCIKFSYKLLFLGNPSSNTNPELNATEHP